MSTQLFEGFKNDTTMKRYAVFAQKSKEAQKEGDYTVWHYLNSTNDLFEAIHWRQGALEHKDYDMVVIVSPISVSAEVGISDISEWATLS